MATAIGVNACNQEKRVKFYRTATLVNQLVQEKEEGRLNKFLETLRKTDLLICDEWGYIPLDREGAQLLFQVIAERYERRSVIITTNLEFSKWNGIFYDDKITGAIIDRLIHHCHLVIFTGKSYCLEHTLLEHNHLPVCWIFIFPNAVFLDCEKQVSLVSLAYIYEFF
jgi:DNA replication protein DnaC